MTINLADNTPRISYTVAQGVTQTSFAVPFEFFDNGDLKVYVDGTLKTITTDYTVSGGDGSTGSITMSVTGATGGSTVVITRDIPLARTTDFPTSGAFAVATLNRELDRFTAMQADRADDNDRSIKLKDQDATSSMELPLKADRVGKYLRFHETTGDIEPTAQAVNTGGITTTLLADSAVTTAKINNAAVTTAKLDSASVTTAKIADTGVTGAKLNTDTISSQTALTSGLAATDELLVSDGGALKRMDVSVVTDYYKDLSVTETNKTLTSAVLNGTISGTSIKDEDDMLSNSASHLATQQSIKAYVDATVTAEDLDLTTDSGTIAIDLDSETLTIAGGEGIDTSATSNTVTITAETATTSNLGVASFSSDNFTVSSGAVSIKDGGIVTAELAADAVTGAKIADNAISEEHLDPSIISSLADTTIASGDHLMFFDATDSTLKKVDAGELGVGSALTEIVGDTTPQLGGNLDVNGNSIVSVSNGDINITPNGTGEVNISKVDIDAGAIDGTTIGANSAAAGTFSSATVTGDLTVDTDTLFVDASADKVVMGTTSADADASVLTIKGTDPAQIYDGQILIHGSATTGAADTGAGIGFKGHHGTGNRNLGAIQSLKENSTSGNADAYMRFVTRSNSGGMAEAARLTSSGDLLVGKSTTAIGTAGSRFISNGQIQATASNNEPFFANRLSSDGVLFDFRKDGTTVGSIANNSTNLKVDGVGALELSENGTTRVFVDAGGFFPFLDNTYDIGSGGLRFDDIFATNGTIQTSDQNEKQQIASLTDAEIEAAKRISNGFKTFKWNDAVAAKGDNARTHTGVIAQEVRTALEAEGLDAGNYAFFMSNTWWEHDVEVPAVESVEAVEAVYEDVVIEAVLDDEGNEVEPERTEQRLVSEAVEAVEAKDAYTRTDIYDTAEEAPEGATERTRLGIRYPELLAFVGAATEQRLTSIEVRLTALEA